METKTSVIVGSITTIIMASATAYQEFRVRSGDADEQKLSQGCSVAIQHLSQTNFEKQQLIDMAIGRNKEMYEDLLECYNELEYTSWIGCFNVRRSGVC